MWNPIDTIPKDGKDYVVISTVPNNRKAEIVYYVNNKDARDEPPYWFGDVRGELEDLSIFTHWTELPKD